MNRRRFLTFLAMAGGSCAVPVLKPLDVVAGLSDVHRQCRLAMGTMVTLTVARTGRAKALEAMEAAFQEVDRLTALLDRRRPDSPLYVLNDRGRLDRAPQEVVDVVRLGVEAHRASGGAFDPTVLPVLTLLEERARSRGGLPDEKEMRHAMELVDGDGLRLNSGRVSFSRRGMAATLDGLAKGRVVDLVSAKLSALDCPDHLVNAGGDIMASGGPDSGRGWRVAVENPFKHLGAKRRPVVVELKNRAMATSGGYERPLPGGSHLVDPRPGLSSKVLAQSTVTAPDCARADALSTALFVAGRAGVKEIMALYPGCGWLAVETSGRTSSSSGFGA